jgi:hypothetical protein
MDKEEEQEVQSVQSLKDDLLATAVLLKEADRDITVTFKINDIKKALNLPLEEEDYPITLNGVLEGREISRY